MRNIFVISAPSGAGKTTLVDMLQATQGGRIIRPVTYTSREPRAGEVNGIHYHFKTRNEFEAMIAEGEFIEYAEVHGNLYGTTKWSISSVSRGDQRVLLILDCAGASSVRRLYPNCTTIFITVPEAILKERLTKRGDNVEDIARRLQTAKAEMGCVHEFDHVIENVVLYQAYAKLESIINHETVAV